MAKVITIEAIILKTQLCWAGHVSRMEDNRVPKIVLYTELSTGHRDRGHLGKYIHRHLEKIPRLLQHRSPPVDNISNQSHELATLSLPGHHFL